VHFFDHEQKTMFCREKHAHDHEHVAIHPSEQYVDVIIDSHEIKQDGAAKYAEYEVRVQILRVDTVKRYPRELTEDGQEMTEYTIHKRYSDFWNLYNAIRTVFRGKLPDFPPRTFFGNSLDATFLKQRKEVLGTWMAALVTNNQYWCMPVEEFLGIQLVDPPLLKRPSENVEQVNGLAKKPATMSEEYQEQIEGGIYEL
jgi:hypothetical protein